MIPMQEVNALSPAETKAGWKLLFDGRSTKGWRTFKEKGVGEGWVVKDGALCVENPEKAGDIMTTEDFRWFVLSLEYNIAKGQNSGIMFHVTEQGRTVWMTGPEIQLFDNAANPEVQQAGWLYELYKADKDATKPAGEWNHLVIAVLPDKCYTEMNGVRYYEYKLGSEDFKARVAKSKFSKMPYFAKAGKGAIAFQGDHGNVKFRNIKILVRDNQK
ncbi:MAG: hypothetical protein HONBIEJF_01749 [Fimbriimonadaceae bacterium]|nr:hypothetical protein [Fimbriimonadaceae bacterium]